MNEYIFVRFKSDFQMDAKLKLSRRLIAYNDSWAIISVHPGMFGRIKQMIYENNGYRYTEAQLIKLRK
jgi:hypothetical protein